MACIDRDISLQLSSNHTSLSLRQISHFPQLPFCESYLLQSSLVLLISPLCLRPSWAFSGSYIHLVGITDPPREDYKIQRIKSRFSCLISIFASYFSFLLPFCYLFPWSFQLCLLIRFEFVISLLNLHLLFMEPWAIGEFCGGFNWALLSFLRCPLDFGHWFSLIYYKVWYVKGPIFRGEDDKALIWFP